MRREGGDAAGAQSPLRTLGERGGRLPQRPLGADPAGGRPRCRDPRAARAPHRPLRRDAPPPEGERWGAPWLGASYPLAAFHFGGDAAAEPFTLCFEDRDGAAGLHRFYDGRLAQEAACRRIALSLRIEPHEYEALFAAGTGAPGIRSVFRLDTGRGAVAATLEGIDGYDPEAASVRCLFTLLPGERP